MKIIAYPATYADGSSVDINLLKEISAELTSIQAQIQEERDLNHDTDELVQQLKDYADTNKVMYYDEQDDIWYYPQGSIERDELGEGHQEDGDADDWEESWEES